MLCVFLFQANYVPPSASPYPVGVSMLSSIFKNLAWLEWVLVQNYEPLFIISLIHCFSAPWVWPKQKYISEYNRAQSLNYHAEILKVCMKLV